MTENKAETPTQDWGKIIGAGIITLFTLVVAVNLIVFKVSSNLLEKLAISPLWLQTARWSGLLLTLGTGGLLLWQTLRQRQPAEEHPPQQAIDHTQEINESKKAA